MASRAKRRTSRLGLAVSVAVLPAVAACTSSDPDGVTPRPPTPAPTSVVLPDTIRISAEQHASLVAIGVGQRYVESYGSGDHQRLMVLRPPGNPTYGPLVAIQPNDSSHSVARARLAAGFVVARFIDREHRGYPKLGIAGGDTTYWFVDSLPSGSWRSRYVSSRYTGTIVEDTTLVIHPTGTAHTRPLARWVWLENDETGWVTCTSAGCCTSREAVRSLTQFESL